VQVAPFYIEGLMLIIFATKILEVISE